MAVQRRWVVVSPSTHLKIEEAAITKIFMTTTGDAHKHSLCLCYCQTKKSQREGTHLMDPSTMQHKKPAMQCLADNKSSTREHKISVAERTS